MEQQVVAAATIKPTRYQELLALEARRLVANRISATLASPIKYKFLAADLQEAVEIVEQHVVVEAEKAALAKQLDEEKTKKAALAQVEAAVDAAKPEACANDIGFFDSTLVLDLPEFHLFNTSISFFQNLDAAAQYKEDSVLGVLAKCLRDPASTWFKTQLDFISLNSFKTALAVAFSASQAPSPTSSEPASHSSLQYHSCPKCNAQFSSTSRLLQHTQKDCFKLACKHCEESFNSNNKLHEHVRLKYTQRPITSPASSPPPRGSLHVFLVASSTTSLRSLAPQITPRKYVIETLKHRLEEKGGKHVNLSLTFFSTFSLSRKPYMTIDDLYAMFADKQQKPSPCDIQLCAPSSSSRQAHTTCYFKPVISSANQSLEVAKLTSAMSSRKDPIQAKSNSAA